MRRPNADRAGISPEKVRDYLLSDRHPVGRFKARFFRGLGYSPDEWKRLATDLHQIVSMMDRSGRAIWQQAYHRKYQGNGVEVSFERAMNHAVNKVLAAAMYDFSGPEFRSACCGSASPDARAAEADRP